MKTVSLQSAQRAKQRGMTSWVLEDIAREMSDYHTKVRPIPHALAPTRLRALVRYLLPNETEHNEWRKGFLNDYGFEW